MIGRARKNAEPSHRLLVQQNGAVVLETRGPGFVKQEFARGLRYRLEYKLLDGSWHPMGWFEDDRGAREALRHANKGFFWRLLAHNDDGTVVLPKGWKGYCA